MLAAMQCDLGLTAAQAHERLAAESTARGVERAAAAALGTAFAGAWFNGDTGRLVVATTDAASLPQLRELGADTLVMPHALSRLVRQEMRLAAVTLQRSLTPLRHAVPFGEV
jgi:hypothetical protein